MNPAKPNPIRVGMIAMSDLGDPNPISGMPFRMATALREQGIDILPIPAWNTDSRASNLSTRASDRLSRIYHRRTPMWVKRAMDTLLPGHTRSAVLKRARTLSGCAQSSLDSLIQRGERIDALFGCCISSALYQLKTDLPIIYFSDATSPLLKMTYPVLALRGSSFRQALHEVEQASLQRTSVAIFAAPVTQQSAIDDFGIDPTRTRVVAMGAHVYPDEPDTVDAPADAPTKEHCNLLIVAADPIRKRVDLATRVAEILRQRGINATLNVVGPGTKRSNTSPAVNSIGPLRLSQPEDRIRHQDLLRDCHLQLLPSRGEAFGIAPCESAHFARPSIVAGAGGLPFVVLDGQTGVVLDIDADANQWAEAIGLLIEEPQRYQALSIKALERARSELNWTSWGRRVRSAILEQIGSASQQAHELA